MVESKGWKWEMVGDDADSVWKIPSKESYYLLNRWQQQQKKAFLDLGCGLGRHAMLFGKNGFDVRCFDISEDAVCRTRTWAENEGLCFRYDIGDMLSLPYDDACVDCILCRNVISHTDTEGVKMAISEIYRVLKCGGECYVTLASKCDRGFLHEDWTAVDANTKLRLEEGPEYGIPHFYTDYGLIFELFASFEIIDVEHIETFNEIHPESGSAYHYHVLCRKNG